MTRYGGFLFPSLRGGAKPRRGNPVLNIYFFSICAAADFIIRRLEEYRSQVAPKPELITEEQQNMCFKLMYRIAEISPSDIKPRERLRGVISKVTGREIRPDRDIFSRVTRAEGSEIIEMLKRILRSEQNKLKRSDKHGTCNAGKEEPP